MKIKTHLLTLIAATALTASSQTLDDAKQLVANGDYSLAIPLLEELATSKPKDSNINVALGDAYRLAGRDREAIEQYNKARARNNNEAYLGLIDIAIREYRLDDADEMIEKYRKALKKGRKSLPDESSTVTQNLERTRNMLARVEGIQVFDSVNVPKDDFFSYYRLSPECGTIIASADIVPAGFPSTQESITYIPQSGNEMIWSAPTADNAEELVRSVALYGNEWDTPEPIGSHLGDGGNAIFPFMMDDGITLYYANNGANSLGGYDIYITRRDGVNFLQPQNLGMPYNSPYDDYMLAIDETTGAGWWASDRNHPGGDSLTIYLFKPAEVRRNVDINDPNLIAKARLSSIAVTQDSTANYNEIRSRIEQIDQAPVGRRNGTPQVLFRLPDGRVITRIEQLSNADARDALRQYIELKEGIEADAEELTRLRQAYAAGDHQARIDILSLEKRALGDREALKKASNEVIRCETSEK